MNHLVYPVCLVVAIAAVVPWCVLYEQHRNRKAEAAAAVPSNVTRLDSRRKAGENVTVLRSVKP